MITFRNDDEKHAWDLYVAGFSAHPDVTLPEGIEYADELIGHRREREPATRDTHGRPMTERQKLAQEAITAMPFRGALRTNKDNLEFQEWCKKYGLSMADDRRDEYIVAWALCEEWKP